MLQNNQPRIVCLLSALCRYIAGGNSFGPPFALTDTSTLISEVKIFLTSFGRTGNVNAGFQDCRDYG